MRKPGASMYLPPSQSRLDQTTLDAGAISQLLPLPCSNEQSRPDVRGPLGGWLKHELPAHCFINRNLRTNQTNPRAQHFFVIEAIMAPFMPRPLGIYQANGLASRCLPTAPGLSWCHQTSMQLQLPRKACYHRVAFHSARITFTASVNSL